MANLTTTAYWTRKLIKYGGLALGAFLVIRFVWGIGIGYFRTVHPSPPPPPTVSFGKLPPLSFPKKEGLPKLSFKLETIEGNVPKLTTVAKVYFMPRPVASFLALDRAKQLARKMGFTNEPASLSETKYRFAGQNTATTLEIDIINQNFKLSYDFVNDQSILEEKKLPNDEQSVSEVKNFLRQIGLLSPDLESGQVKISYLRLVTPDLTPAISLSEADFVKVDLFRSELDSLRILSQDPNQALISFIFSGSRQPGKRIVEVNYNYHSVEQENYATYPLKNSTAAWQELIGNQGFVASLGENQDGKVTVRKVYLAYFEGRDIQDFLQPIFVFEGDRNFVAYVPAVDPKWIE